ncbi:MAG: heat-inducible transcription repressor HrcA [Gemmatimonadetes bacterium]|nr:heat-inducible transcription repressor HrcA [Gemmatimonadota bacterium]
MTERERRVLDAVIRTYVDTAEPTGSRTVARKYELGVSPATVRNTMSDLEEKGYLYHPHTSAGRIPTDLAYRFFVDQLMERTALSDEERDRLIAELQSAEASAVDRLIRRATHALSLLTSELGVAIAPRLDDAILEKIDLIQVSSAKVLMVLAIRGGVVRTVYVDLAGEVPPETLLTLTQMLNERLAGLTLREIRETLPARLTDSAWVDDPAAEELLNIFLQSGSELFDWPPGLGPAGLHLGQASLLATQPEFTSGERLRNLIQLTERRDLIANVLGSRQHEGRLVITIGTEHNKEELSGFTLVTAEYEAAGLKGVIGVIGPTRMPYEKIIAIVDHTSSLISRLL